MLRLSPIALLLAALIASAPVFSATTGGVVVDTLQAPVWIERNGQKQAARPEMPLKNHDRIVTGDGARVQLRLGDGSTVKLGGDTSLSINALQHRPHAMLTAAFDIAKGAFRFTTQAALKLRQSRAINIRVGTVTAGIRGTDLWGRAGDDRDFICLLEGKISATHPESGSVMLTEALQFYGADKGQAARVDKADPAEIERWAQTTELSPQQPRFRKGDWSVVVGNFETREQTLAAYDKLNAAGYPTRIQLIREAEGSNLYRYRLVVGPLPAQQDARKLATQLTDWLGSPAAETQVSQAARRPL